MKKLSCLVLSTIALLFTACTEASYEMHQTNFWPQKPDGIQLYADQTYDTISVYSFDPWTAEVQATTSWFTINPTSGEARPGTSAFTRLDINTMPNTTGKNRKGYITVKAYDNNTIAMPVYQNSWLNIMFPSAIYTGDTYEEKKAIFSIAVTAQPSTQVLPPLNFYINNERATLTSNAEWVTPENTSFNQGNHHVKLTISDNESKEKRSATLTLTSAGISTEIFVNQEGKKDKEEK